MGKYNVSAASVKLSSTSYALKVSHSGGKTVGLRYSAKEARNLAIQLLALAEDETKGEIYITARKIPTKSGYAVSAIRRHSNAELERRRNLAKI